MRRRLKELSGTGVVTVRPLGGRGRRGREPPLGDHVRPNRPDFATLQ